MRTLLLVIVTCLLVSASMTVVEGLPPECEKLSRMLQAGFVLTEAEVKFISDNCLTEKERKDAAEAAERVMKQKSLICTWSTSPSCVRCKFPMTLNEGDDPKAM
jgi:hypothetical protein